MNDQNINNIAKKYAQAFINIFPKAISFNDLKKIEAAQSFLQTHKRTLFFLQLPQFDQERKKSMVVDLIDYFSLPQDLVDLICLLIEHNRSFLIPEALVWITLIYKERINSVTFSVQSAHEIDTHQLESIKHFLSYLTHKKIIAVPSLNTSLIAGLRLQSNEHLWEYSVRKQIKAVQALRK